MPDSSDTHADAAQPSPPPERRSLARRIFDPQRPISPKRFPFFYGWFLAPIAALGLLASMPGQTIGVGSFTPHLIESFRLPNDSLLTLAYMIGTITSGLLLPFVGKKIETVGVRRTGVFVFIGFGLTLIFMAGVGWVYQSIAGPDTDLPQLAFVIVLIGYFFLRFLGQGVVSILPNLMVQRWFNRLRGRVAGIFNAIAALGFSTAPFFLDLLVESVGGVRAWLYLGCFMIFFMATLAYLFYRDSPEQCGLEMDGGWKPRKAQSAEKTARFTTYHDFTALEAVRTLPFWFFALGLGYQSFTVTAIFFHRVVMVGEMGIEPDAFKTMLVGSASANIFLSLLIGFLTDRMRLRNTLLLLLTGTALLVAGVLTFPSPWGYVLWIAGSGLSWSCYGILINAVWPRYYGRAHLGSINGIAMATLVICSAIGPHYYTLMNQAFGSYESALLPSLIWPAVILLGFFFVRNPQLKYAPPEVRNAGSLSRS